MLLVTDRLSLNYYHFYDALAKPLHDLARLRLGPLWYTLKRSMYLYFYINLFILPFSLLWVAGWFSRLSSWRASYTWPGWWRWTIGVTGLLSVTGTLFPMLAQGSGFVQDFGVGDRTLMMGTWPAVCLLCSGWP